MKTIKYFAFGLLTVMALAVQAQSLSQPGWYSSLGLVKPLAPGAFGSAPSQPQALASPEIGRAHV